MVTKNNKEGNAHNEDFSPWNEGNVIFGKRMDMENHNDNVKEDRGQGDNDCEEPTQDANCYTHIVFDYDEIAGDPITLRTHKKGVEGSTGLAVWMCSQILAAHLIDNPQHVQNESVLELGSGLGLCSIIAHKLQAKQVLATDGDIHVLQNLCYNINQNALAAQKPSPSESDSTIRCRQLVWGHQLDVFRANHTGDQLPSTILAADVFYTSEAVKPLWETIQQLLAEDGQFLLAFCPHELPISHVLDEARRMGFTWRCPDIGCTSSDHRNDEAYADDCSFDDPVPSDRHFGYHLFRFVRRKVQSSVTMKKRGTIPFGHPCVP